MSSTVERSRNKIHHLNQPPSGEGGGGMPETRGKAERQRGGIMSRWRSGSMPRWMASCAWTVGFLLVFADAGMHGAIAQTPTPTTLVSNNENFDQYDTEARISLGNPALAQPFRTGTNAGGYSIDSIQFTFANNPCAARSTGYDLVIEIVEGVAGSTTTTPPEPSTVPSTADTNVLHRWTASSTVNERLVYPTTYDVDGTAGYTHTTPKATAASETQTVLSPRTTYFIVVRADNVEGTDAVDCADWSYNDDATLHIGGTNGWSLPSIAQEYSESNSAWQEYAVDTSRLRFEISGFEEEAPVPVVTVVADGSPAEGSPARFTLTRVGDITSELAGIRYSIDQTGGNMLLSGTTLPIEGTATFGADSATTEVMVATDDDMLDEEDGILTLTLSAPSPSAEYLLGDDTSAAVTVTDNDDPVVSFDEPGGSAGSATEGGTISFTVRLSVGSTRTITVPYSHSGNAEGGGVDYTATPASPLTFEPGDTVKTISIVTVDDERYETDESMNVMLGSPTNATLTGTVADQSVRGVIVDNDGEPTVSIEATTGTIAEGGDLVFTVTVTPTSGRVTTIPYSVAGSGTRQAVMADFTDSGGGTLTIQNNIATGTITITTVDDDLDEYNEMVTVTLGSPTNASLSATPSEQSAEGTITDNDEPEVSVAWVDSAPVAEGGSLEFTFTLDSASAKEVRVPFMVAGGGTHPAGSGDYRAPTASEVVFAPDDTSETVTIVTIEDAEDEPDEGVTVELGATQTDAAPATNVADRSATGIIADDDAPEFTVENASAMEGSAIEFMVTKSIASWQSIMVTATVGDGTVDTGDTDAVSTGANPDYTPGSPRVLTFAPADLTHTFTVDTNQNTDMDGNRSFTVTLSSVTPSGAATLPSDPTAIGTIIDDEIPSVSIDSPTLAAEGNSGTRMVTFMVAPSAAPAANATVSYEITNTGTATINTDFTVTDITGTLNFAAGDAAPQQVVVTVIGDEIHEVDETVIVELSMPTPSSAIALGTATGTATITDDDAEPVISITSPTVDEGDSGDTTALSYVLTKTGATELPVSVTYAISGSSTAVDSDDYTHTVDSPIEFTATEMTQPITINVVGDNLAEADERVIVTLSSPMGATLMGGNNTLDGTGTIRNDDLLELSVSDATATEGDSGDTATMTFTVRLDAVPPEDVTVSYAVADGTATASDDYTVASATGTLTFAANTASLTQTIEVMVNGDTVPEVNETLTVTLSRPACTCPVGVTATLKMDEDVGTGTIVDNDAPTFTVSVDDVTEGDSGDTAMTFTVTMTTAWSQEVTVDYAVTGGTAAGEATVDSDFRAESGTLSFAPAVGGNPGETEKTVEVTINGDRAIEPDETLTLTLSNVTGGAQISQVDWTGTILSDDYELTVATVPASVAEPASGTAEIAFTVTLTEDPGRRVELDYAIGGSATEGADYMAAAATAMEDRGTAEAGKLVFAGGATVRTVRLLVNSDIVDEGNETVAVEVFSAGGTSLGEAEATIAPPESSPGVAVVPDAVVSVESVRTHEEEGTTTAVFQVSVDSTNRDFAVEVHWRVTQIADATAASAPARSSGAAAPRALRVERVLADSGTAPNRPLTLAATASEAELTATLSEAVSPGAILGFEITGLSGGCGTRTCTVSQGDEVTPERQLALSQGSSPSTAAVAAVFRARSFDERATRIQRYALAGHGVRMVSGIVGGIWRRADAHRTGNVQSTARIGGRAIDTNAMASGDAGMVARETARLLGVEAVQPPRAMAGDGDGFAEGSSGDLAAWRSRTIMRDGENLMERSRFSLVFGDGFEGKSMAVWGKGAVSSFESEPDNESLMEGAARVTLVGVDWQSGNYLAGVALSRLSGDSDYETEGGGQSGKGSLETSLTGVAPYMHWLSETGLGVWGSAGVGSGTAELASGSAKADTDVTMTMLALGAKSPSTWMGEMEFALRGDYFRTGLTAEQAANLDELAAEASRLRVAVEGVATRELGNSGTMSNSIELGARLDSGDGEEGAGADIAAEVRYVSSDGALEVAGQFSGLLAHQQDGFRELGAGLDVAYAPGRSGRGLRLSLEPRWNVPRTGSAESLWSGAAPGAEIGSADAADAGASLRARLGYGLAALGELALASPYGEMEAGGGERRLRFGVEFRGVSASLERLGAELYGERSETASEDAESRAMVEARLEF